MKKLFALILACALSVAAFADQTYTFKIGDPVTFTATLTGSAPITVQWFKNGTAIAGATSLVYRIPSLAATDVGTYTLQATNAYGSSTSENGFLVQGVAPGVSALSITKL
jgi:Immunoglobulin I-set domain